MTSGTMQLFLCGDVMTGRGIDQILPHPGDPTLREPVVADARTYVRLAERVNGPILRPAPVTWPWGDALAILDEYAPDVRLINLETTVTVASDFAPGKAVHYRMHPDNVGCLTAVRPDVCVLANNHIMDFGPAGLAESLHVLADAGLATVGAGADDERARRPAVAAVPGRGRVVISAVGCPSSGVPAAWAAGAERPGVAYVDDSSDRHAVDIADGLLARKRPGDIGVVSLHWGSNWGYDIDSGQRRFAHRLIDAGVDVVYGHSSHHPRPIEVYRGKLVLYGCGDLVNDYEGIEHHGRFRDELRLLYFATIDSADGTLAGLDLVPMRARRLRLEHASRQETAWLQTTLDDVSRRFGTRVDAAADGSLSVHSG